MCVCFVFLSIFCFFFLFFFSTPLKKVLLDSLAVRERLPRPLKPRPADEAYADGGDLAGWPAVDPNDVDDAPLGEGGASAPQSPLGSATAAKVASSASSLSSTMANNVAGVYGADVAKRAAQRELDARQKAQAAAGHVPAVPLPPRQAPRGSLVSLALAGVPLGSAGCGVLSDALDELRHLQHLSLANCHLTDRGRATAPCWALLAALEDEQPPPLLKTSTAFGPKKGGAPAAEDNDAGESLGESDEGGAVMRGAATVGKSGVFWKMTCLPKPPGRFRKGTVGEEEACTQGASRARPMRNPRAYSLKLPPLHHPL